MRVLVFRTIDDRSEFGLFRFDPIFLQRSIDDDLIPFVHFFAVTKPIVDADLDARRVAIEKSNEEDACTRSVLTDVPVFIDMGVIFIDDLHGHLFFQMFLQATASDGHRPEQIVQDNGELLQIGVIQLTELDDLLLNTIGMVEKNLLSFVRSRESTEELLRKSDQTIHSNLRNLAIISFEDFERVNLRVLIVLLKIELRALIPRL